MIRPKKSCTPIRHTHQAEEAFLGLTIHKTSHKTNLTTILNTNSSSDDDDKYIYY